MSDIEQTIQRVERDIRDCIKLGSIHYFEPLIEDVEAIISDRERLKAELENVKKLLEMTEKTAHPFYVKTKSGDIVQVKEDDGSKWAELLTELSKAQADHQTILDVSSAQEKELEEAQTEYTKLEITTDQLLKDYHKAQEKIKELQGHLRWALRRVDEALLSSHDKIDWQEARSEVLRFVKEQTNE